MFDYIVVGAGSAGCTLAARLTENPETTVLLIEAGPPDRKREIHIPAAFSKLFKSPLDWDFTTAPQEHLNGRRLYWPRGKMLGGSSSMNAMVYVRGARADYDHWRDLGNVGWGFEDVKTSFEAAESATGGPLSVTAQTYTNPLSHVFVEACGKSGIPRNDDFDGASQFGAGLYRVTQKNGARASTADAYLRRALGRGNLTVWTEIHATRVVIENGRAVGMEYLRKDQRHEVRASREVILCAGAIGSPHLLMLSGVGPRLELERYGIAPIADLPGVGDNLQDHLSVILPYFCKQAITLDHAASPSNIARYVLRKSGPLASNIAEAGAFVKSSRDLTECDLQLLFGPLHYIEHGFVHPEGPGFSLGPILLTPASNGLIRLASANPLDAPVIDPRYLTDPDDLARLIEGVKVARRVVESAPFDPYRGDPVFDFGSDLAAYVRARAETLYHPVGTCRMGGDQGCVVNAKLQVYGITGLRVADASVMPVIPRANTNAATIMIAEHAARILKEKE